MCVVYELFNRFKNLPNKILRKNKKVSLDKGKILFYFIDNIIYNIIDFINIQ